MPHQKYNFWPFVCVLFTSWLIRQLRRRRRRRRQHVHTFPGILEAFDFWSTFNLTGCVSELRLVTLSDLSFFLFSVLLLLYSFFVLLIKHKKNVSSNKIMFSNFIFQGARQVHSVSFSTPWQVRNALRRQSERQRERGREGERERERGRRHPSRANWFLYLFSYLFSFWQRVEPSSTVRSIIAFSLPLPPSLFCSACVLLLL